MEDDRGIHPKHIYRGPCEHVKVVGQKLLELAFLSGRKLPTNPENSVWVIGVRKKQFGLLLLFMIGII